MLFVSVCLVCFLCDNYIVPCSKNYNRSVYSVVVLNDTDVVLDDIEVLYGDNDSEHNTVQKYCTIDCVESNQYKKVNIPTDDVGIEPPYNVYISFPEKYGIDQMCIGYFGIDTGGFEIVKVSETVQGFYSEVLSSKTNEYKKIYRWHRKNQNITSG